MKAATHSFQDSGGYPGGKGGRLGSEPSPTGLHDPLASHLALLYAIAPSELVRAGYAEAVREWHELGDSHLLLGKKLYD